jgi:CheY-like chemotaxis protein
MQPVIMIDDDPEDLEMTRELVKKFAIPNEIITFSDPLEALTFLTGTGTSPLFIICDVNMPKMDGFELRDELLKNPGIQKVPFFFLSTSKSPGEIVLAQECKADGYYQKAGSFAEQEKILETMFTSAKNTWQNR